MFQRLNSTFVRTTQLSMINNFNQWDNIWLRQSNVEKWLCSEGHSSSEFVRRVLQLSVFSWGQACILYLCLGDNTLFELFNLAWECSLQVVVQFSSRRQNQTKERRAWVERSGQVFGVVLNTDVIWMILQFNNFHSDSSGVNSIASAVA